MLASNPRSALSVTGSARPTNQPSQLSYVPHGCVCTFPDMQHGAHPPSRQAKHTLTECPKLSVAASHLDNQAFLFCLSGSNHASSTILQHFQAIHVTSCCPDPKNPALLLRSFATALLMHSKRCLTRPPHLRNSQPTQAPVKLLIPCTCPWPCLRPASQPA